MIGALERILDAHHLTNPDEKFRCTLGTVVRQYLSRNTALKQNLFLEGFRHRKRIYFTQWNRLSQLREYFLDDEKKG